LNPGVRVKISMRAIPIIHDEHRSLAAVLHGMLHIVRAIGTRGMAPDFRLLDAMVRYIDAFPERFHHPKEDAYLFKRLRARCPEAHPIIAALETEHRDGATKIRGLAQALERYRKSGRREFLPFANAVEAYAGFHWRHMRTEEDTLLPLARAHLTADDWNEIDDAFTGHSDPLFGVQAGVEYDMLFRRIVTLAPAPIGLGPLA
jgi:hemerythrin-like domain-containing protein